MTAMTEEQMKRRLEITDVRDMLLERLDVENFVRNLSTIDESFRHKLQYSSESTKDKVSMLLEHILRKHGALKEFYHVLEQKEPSLYKNIMQYGVIDDRLNITSSIFQISAKFISLDGVPFESTGCGTLVEILVAGQSLCGILAAFAVFTYRKEYKLVLVTLGAQEFDIRDFSFEVRSGQYIFACDFLKCSFLVLNEDQINYLKSKQCRFLRVDHEDMSNGNYEKSIIAVTVKKNKIFSSRTSHLAAAGCQLFFGASISLSPGSPVLGDHSPDAAKVIALYSCGSSHLYFNSTAIQCGYIVAALQHDRACSNATLYPRATDPLNLYLEKRLREIHVRCISATGCMFLTDIKPYKKIHLLRSFFFDYDAEEIIEELDNMYCSSGFSSWLWRVVWRGANDRRPEAFLQKMATTVINGVRILLERSNTFPVVSIQEGFMQSTCVSPTNLTDYISSLIDDLIVRYGQQIDNLLCDRLSTTSTCLKSHCNIKNCESWMTADSSIWQLISTLEQHLDDLVRQIAYDGDEPVLKLGILLFSVVVFLHKARFVVNCIPHGTDWKIKILERLELRRTHHHWFWRVRFEFRSPSKQGTVQDVTGPWSRANVKIDPDIWQDIHAILQKVSELTEPTDAAH